MVERLMRSRYFFVALLLHVAVFLMLGTYVIYEAFEPRENFETALVSGGDGGPPPPPPPPPSSQAAPSETPPVPTASAASDLNELFAVDVPSLGGPSIPVAAMIVAPPSLGDISDSVADSVEKLTPKKNTGLGDRAQGIRKMLKSWGRGKGTTRGSGKKTVAKFKCYLAKYSQGDWSTTVVIDKNKKIVAGSLVNLLLYTDEASRGRIKAEIIPKPLDLSSQEIFQINPPFIYFTGHKDFVLTDQEVQNLRRYVIQGGAIWGDNGLAGKGSRFDVAFRREMKRVLPDDDKPFVELPDNHPIYTEAYYTDKGPPEGMNFFQEPTEGIYIDEHLAIIYTLNNYSDMWRMALEPNTLEVIFAATRDPNALRQTPENMYYSRNQFYRNFEPASVRETQKFGLNIIVFLLTRFDEALKLSPL